VGYGTSIKDERMTKADIEQRLAELRKSLEQIQANGNALMGAINDCEYWLNRIQEAEQSEELTA